MCNLKEERLGKTTTEEETNAFMNDVNAAAIGQTLAEMGDKLNEDGKRNCDCLRLVTLGIALSFATFAILNTIM